MSSPERMEMLAAAVARLAEWARLMDAEQEARTARLRDYDEWLGEHETRFQEYELRFRERDARLRKLDEESQANQARMREMIMALTQIQADLARLDAAS
ncbi:MAG: hypothetical protein OXI25_06535 [Chloroflexota bacterium]|nr:hypothetical protein [Chloroflexota bacterium]